MPLLNGKEKHRAQGPQLCGCWPGQTQKDGIDFFYFLKKNFKMERRSGRSLGFCRRRTAF
jgi:hypothetical protein